LPAMGAPMLPRPINAIFAIGFLSVLRSAVAAVTASFLPLPVRRPLGQPVQVPPAELELRLLPGPLAPLLQGPPLAPLLPGVQVLQPQQVPPLPQALQVAVPYHPA
jgi:hypothetical protein